jgi:hypothetical protein
MSKRMSLPPDRDLPARRLQLRREHLVQEITTSRRGVRPLVLAFAAATLVLSATGFGAYALTREPTHVDSIGCFEQADLSSSVAVIGAAATDPVAACAALWRSGALGSTSNVPSLTACVLDTGAVAVMPGEQGICEGLGIASLSADARVRLARFGELRAALAQRFGDSSGSKKRTACVDEAAATRIVRAELEARGLADWAIEITSPFNAERRCASASIVPAARTIMLIPISP